MLNRKGMNYASGRDNHVSTQANLSLSEATTYESEDEATGGYRRRQILNKRATTPTQNSTPLYSKEDIREQYCISDKQVHVLETSRQPPGLFGCISSYNDASCGRSSSSNLLSVCVKRKIPSDENLYELSRRPMSEYAPFPRWRTPHPHFYIPHAHYLYGPYRDQMYYLRHPFQYDWVPEPEKTRSHDMNNRYRPPSFEVGTQFCPQSPYSTYPPPTTEHIKNPMCPAHPYIPPPPPPPPPAPTLSHSAANSSLQIPPTTPRPRHVSFAKSHTMTSFDDSVTSLSTTGTSCSQERLIDGRKTVEQNKEQPKVIVMEVSKKLSMKTQATQTEVCLGRKPIQFNAFKMMSPDTRHRSAQTSNDNRKLFKCNSELGPQTNSSKDSDGTNGTHEPLLRSKSEEPQKSTFYFTSPKKYSNEILINFEPQAKKPLQKTLSDGEIISRKSVIEKYDAASDCEICYQDVSDNEQEISDKSSHTSSKKQLTASESFDEEFHENLIYDKKLFRQQSASSEENSIDDIDGKTKSEHLHPLTKLHSPAISNDSLNTKDLSDSIWNESLTTVLQADSDNTIAGAGFSLSDASSPLTPNNAAAKRHLLLLQHQQRSSVDTDILENDDLTNEKIARTSTSQKPVKNWDVEQTIETKKESLTIKNKSNESWKKRSYERINEILTTTESHPGPTLTDSERDCLTRNDLSGRIGNDVSETSTTDGYITATDSTSGVTGMTQGPSAATSSFESASSHISFSKTDNSEDYQLVPAFFKLADDEKIEKGMDNESTSGQSSSCGSYSVDENAQKSSTTCGSSLMPSQEEIISKGIASTSMMNMQQKQNRILVSDLNIDMSCYVNSKSPNKSSGMKIAEKSPTQTRYKNLDDETLKNECNNFYIDKTSSYTIKRTKITGSTSQLSAIKKLIPNNIGYRGGGTHSSDESSEECSCRSSRSSPRRKADKRESTTFPRTKKRNTIEESRRRSIPFKSPFPNSEEHLLKVSKFNEQFKQNSNKPIQELNFENTMRIRTTLSAESLRSISPGSDSVFYSEQSSLDHSSSCYQHRSECKFRSQPSAINCVNNILENNLIDEIVKPPAEFEDSPKSSQQQVSIPYGRVFKKPEKRYRSEERWHHGRSHSPTSRARSEERIKDTKKDTRKFSSRPLTRSTDVSMEKLRTNHSNVASDDDEELSGIYADAYLTGSWIHVSDTDNIFPWCLTNKEDKDRNRHLQSFSQKQTAFSECTESEDEFHRKYETIVNNIVHRKTSTELHKKLATNSFKDIRHVAVCRDSREYGFRIRGSRPVIVSVVEHGSPAENCGLQVGDVILCINEYNILDISHSEVLKIFQECADDYLKLEVAQTKDIIRSENHYNNSQCLKCGTIRKQIVSNHHASWVLRFFRLKEDNCLYYYKSELDTIPIGAVYLCKYSVQRIADSSRPHCFLITKKDCKTVYLSTDTSEECESWVTALCNAAKKQCGQIKNGKSLNISVSSIYDYDYRGSLSTLVHQRGSQWKRQYCVLRAALLYFYDDANSNTALGIAYLHGYKVQSASSASRRHAFELVPLDSSLRYFLFYTDTSIDKRRWMAALDNSIERWIKL